MVVGWYHSHPGFGCWLSGVDINTQQVVQLSTFMCLYAPICILERDGQADKQMDKSRHLLKKNKAAFHVHMPTIGRARSEESEFDAF